MQPHPDFADIKLDREVVLGAYRLSPLTANDTEEDFEAVMSSAHVLGDVFGDWPAGLTLDENRIDLAWHDREFTTRRSFSWVLRDAAGVYLGCFYVFPDLGTRGTASAVFWLRDMPKRDAIAAEVFPRAMSWVSDQIGDRVTLEWTFAPAYTPPP